MPTTLTHSARRAGAELAAGHPAASPGRLDPSFGRRTRAVRGRLREVYGDLSSGVREDLPDATVRWLLQNDFVLEEALESLKDALPPRFLRRLPVLPDAGVRVESILDAWMGAEPGFPELRSLRGFLAGYQEAHSLTLAELWAIPSFLRLLLLERLLGGLGPGPEAESTGPGPYIRALRALASMDWRREVDALSRAEAILRRDPERAYASMDFRSRDRYRSRLERVADRCGVDEFAVAEAACSLAASRPSGTREHHVGFFLVDEGHAALYEALGGRVPYLVAPGRRRKVAGVLYMSGMGLFALLFLLGAVALLPDGAATLVLLLGAVVPALGVAVGLTNWIAGLLVPAAPLPRMDYRKGIPERARTVVAVPVLLTSPGEIDEIVHRLEANFEASRDPALTFALLSDGPDAEQERSPGDEELLRSAGQAIAALNRKHGARGRGPFVLLHRNRRWNPAEKRWMGWERKRGKLSELNKLLLGHPSELWVAEGDPGRLARIRYVLTLDADTGLPQGAAARLVGTLDHPLNRPVVGKWGRTRAGFSVLQPRIELLPDPSGSTPFARIYAGVQGLDLYAHAAFDVYQDLFGAAIFAGKGIYDVVAFEASLEGRTPDNHLLSHDLFEGEHGRAGLVSDLVLLEDVPGHPLAFARRNHRWIRGDWQLLPWLFPRVPLEGGRRGPNPLGWLSRWKILDNLRRSLHAPALLVLFLAGWWALPSPGAWTLLLLGVVGLPFLLDLAGALGRAIRHFPSASDLRVEARALGRSLGRCFLQLAFLPFEAWNAADAVVRTLHRVMVSRSRLLEWATAAATARSFSRSGGLRVLVRAMWPGPAGAMVGVAGLGLTAGGGAAPAAGLVALVWFVSPLMAWYTQRQVEPGTEDPGLFPEADARRLARRVWGYYEEFQGPDGHWLPPDHFQESPLGEVAFRTSPTNLGMGLVAAVTAWDLGFLDTSRLVARLRIMADGMESLPRHRGHFLNWYDTRRLEALEPHYVSTVDSGNLAVALLATREALREVAEHPFPSPRRLRGVLDTVLVLGEVAREAGSEGALDAVAREAGALAGWLAPRIPGSPPGAGEAVVEAGVEAEGSAELTSASSSTASSPEELRVLLAEFRDERLPSLLLRVAEADRPEVTAWADHLRGDVLQALDEIDRFLPWHRASDSGREALSDRVSRDPAVDRILKHIGSIAGPGPTLARLHVAYEALGDLMARDPSVELSLPGLERGLRRARQTVRMLEEDLRSLDDLLERWFTEMEFDYLFDRGKGLFHIGASVSTGELDPSYYDLLASEARIASAVAMARGEVSSRHWLRLGRPFALPDRHAGRSGRGGGGPVLLSWSGTMFEYIMPRLFFRSPAESLLEDACRRAVAVQRTEGERHGLPWGISESGYHLLSSEGHYQYHAFGAPGLALRRDVQERRVVAPYASLMAVGVSPGAVHRNVAHLRDAGGMGPWGPYEALDYGAGSQPRSSPLVVRSYMSHHHGMILAALGNLLTEDRLVDRVHRDPRMAMFEPMLHERIPFRRPLRRRWVEPRAAAPPTEADMAMVEWSVVPERWPPPVHYLTSGELVVGMAPDGRGGSRWNGWSVLRGWVGAGYRPTTPDLALRDLESGEAWRALATVEEAEVFGGEDPGETSRGQVIFKPHGAEFVRQSRGIRTRMEVTLPPGGNTEIREIRVANAGARPRKIRVALGLEVALAPIHDDMRHPAFHKLFVRGERLADGSGVLFTRRPRSEDEEAPMAVVALFDERSRGQPIRWDVSRERFVGRGSPAGLPAALEHGNLEVPDLPPHHPLDPMAGAVVDLDLAPWEEVRLALVVSVGTVRATVVAEAGRFEFEGRREWARGEARAAVERELKALGAAPEDPRRWELMLSLVLAGGSASTPEVATFGGELRQSELWRWGISGDVPYLLVEGELSEDSAPFESLLRAQAWWRARGEKVDVVLVDGSSGAYMAPVRERVRTLLSRLGQEEFFGQPGGIHMVPGEDLGSEGRTRLRRLAAHVMHLGPSGPPRPSTGDTRGAGVDLFDGGGDRLGSVPPAPQRMPPADRRADDLHPRLPVGEGVTWRYEPEARAWQIRLAPGAATPAPWVNVVARDALGFLVSESGSGFTWAADAGEYRLSPWSNDPVRDPSGEMLFLRDERSGRIWTPAPGVHGRHREHQVRHGWGWSEVRASSDDLEETLSWSLHPEVDAKVIRLKLRNHGSENRRIQATYLVDWVLGPHPSRTRGRVDAVFDAGLEAILARNLFDVRFAGTTAWLAADQPLAGFTLDRGEFLGPEGQEPELPPGLLRPLAGRSQRVDRRACGVLQVDLVVLPGEEAEVSFFLGVGPPAPALAGLRASPEPVAAATASLATAAAATEPVATGPVAGSAAGPSPGRAAGPATGTGQDNAMAVVPGGTPLHLLDAEAPWRDLLDRVRIRTPESDLDPLMNGWLPYQSISSRLRGRTGFYQSGGALGFRDQLQDAWALLPLDPGLARDQLVAAAARQFPEGDVLHWWHPGTHRGVRTRCSDDLLWLPWVLKEAVAWTGDIGLLDLRAPYLEGRPLAAGEEERYDNWSPAPLDPDDPQGSLWNHALRAVTRSTERVSDRGIPLMEAGDWNDGMNRVGAEGRGESIWLAWFLHDTCAGLLPLAQARGEDDAALHLTRSMEQLRSAVEAHGWDGQWYRRAFFDNGSPLGSRISPEARIDSIAQSWAVLSGAASRDRARRALDSAWEQLVRPDAGVALLLDPPFEGRGPNPGYIAAYPPGVRENGGQYTHAAAWLLRALARTGNGGRVGDLLRLLLPTRHAGTQEGMLRYRVEPYVLAADVYGAAPHTGRGGWTWYTGSAGWLWRVTLEDVLGVARRGRHLRLRPCIPPEWDRYEVHLQVGRQTIEIEVLNPEGVATGIRRCLRDGEEVDPERIGIDPDASGTIHVQVEMGARPPVE